VLLDSWYVLVCDARSVNYFEWYAYEAIRLNWISISGYATHGSIDFVHWIIMHVLFMCMWTEKRHAYIFEDM